MKRLLAGFGVLLITIGVLHAQPEGVVSSVRREGVMVTSASQPEFFIFQSGVAEEHFDGSGDSIRALGGIEVAEPITGLHYMRPRLVVNASPWSPEDAKLLDAEFHGASTGNFYLFKTVEGRLFYLPKQGETPVVRIDYVLKGGRTVTVWARK
jgi:hypothetical protein